MTEGQLTRILCVACETWHAESVAWIGECFWRNTLNLLTSHVLCPFFFLKPVLLRGGGGFAMLERSLLI